MKSGARITRCSTRLRVLTLEVEISQTIVRYGVLEIRKHRVERRIATIQAGVGGSRTVLGVEVHHLERRATKQKNVRLQVFISHF